MSVSLSQLDLKQLPPVIVNRILRREPLAIHYIRRSIITPISTQPSLIPSFALSGDPDLSTSVNVDIPYEDANPVTYFTNRYSDGSQRFSRSPSSPVYPWIKQTGANSVKLRPKSSTFSILSPSNSGYSIRPLRDDSPSPSPRNDPEEHVEEVTDSGLPESGPVPYTPPEPTPEERSHQPAMNPQLPPRCRAFSTSLPDFDLSTCNDLPDRIGAESSSPIKSSPQHIQGHQHLTDLLPAGLLARSNTSRIVSSPCFSSSL